MLNYTRLLYTVGAISLGVITAGNCGVTAYGSYKTRELVNLFSKVFEEKEERLEEEAEELEEGKERLKKEKKKLKEEKAKFKKESEGVGASLDFSLCINEKTDLVCGELSKTLHDNPSGLDNFIQNYVASRGDEVIVKNASDFYFKIITPKKVCSDSELEKLFVTQIIELYKDKGVDNLNFKAGNPDGRVTFRIKDGDFPVRDSLHYFISDGTNL